MAIGRAPLLVMVTACAVLATPTVCCEKVRLLGETLKAGVATAVPLSVTVCVCNASLIWSAPVSVPVCVGAKVTEMAQLLPAASWLPQVFDSTNCPEGELLVVMVIDGSGRPPLLVRVMVCAAESVLTAVAALLIFLIVKLLPPVPRK